MWFRRKTNRADATPRPIANKVAAPSGRSATSLRRVKLPVDLLEIGMKVVKLDRPWTEVPVLFQGFILTDPGQAQVLRHYCEWVMVEDEEVRLAPVIDKLARQRKRTTEPMAETRSLLEEIPRAKATWHKTRTFIERVIRDIEQGNNNLHFQHARPIIRHCVDSIKANASAMFWMSRIKSRNAYTAEHCLRVAIFTVAFARFLGMPDEDLEIAGLCGLLHDIGKLKVPASILNKPGALSPDEFSVMQKHTTLGYDLLKQDPDVDTIISDVSVHHHERIDGLGYPHQLEEPQISRFARLVSIVDAFDAITSDRCYRDGLPTSDAMRILYSNRGQQFDTEMVEAFIRMIGIYPPGSLVELSSGEVALIVATHPGKKLKPRIEILLDTDKNPVTPRVLDLSQRPDDTQPVILRPLPDGAFGISLQGRVQQLVAGDRP
ncbi:MAG: HD-GYP domain-containing protein [Marinobacter sp.]|nr:HD-GYP domain-containing protein [Marinobacter sp.]